METFKKFLTGKWDPDGPERFLPSLPTVVYVIVGIAIFAAFAS